MHKLISVEYQRSFAILWTSTFSCLKGSTRPRCYASTQRWSFRYHRWKLRRPHQQRLPFHHVLCAVVRPLQALGTYLGRTGQVSCSVGGQCERSSHRPRKLTGDVFAFFHRHCLNDSCFQRTNCCARAWALDRSEGTSWTRDHWTCGEYNTFRKICFHLRCAYLTNCNPSRRRILTWPRV